MLSLASRERNAGDRGGVVGSNLVGSPPQRPVSPSIAVQMNSPPRELQERYPMHHRTSQLLMLPVTRMGAPGNGRDPTGSKSMLSHEISELTQKQLTSEVTIAEMNNQRVEAEIRQRNLEHELSQEVHRFNQARTLISEMRSAFDVEDQGCIRRIEMLESQRNEYAMGLMEMGNRTEVILQERYQEFSEEIERIKQRSEAYVGQQNEDISGLTHELMIANSEIQKSIQGRAQFSYTEREMAHVNEMLSSELLMQKANTQHQEAEISLMQNSLP